MKSFTEYLDEVKAPKIDMDRSDARQKSAALRTAFSSSAKHATALEKSMMGAMKKIDKMDNIDDAMKKRLKDLLTASTNMAMDLQRFINL